jgi:hypothetical protein
VALRWTRVEKLAKEKLGLDEPGFRAVLAGHRISSATVTNWKNRPIPPKRYALLAKVLNCSVDELLDQKAAAAGSGEHEAEPPVDLEPKSMAGDLADLSPESRRIVAAMIAWLRNLEAPAVRKSKAR